jgi:RNA polymerase sigma-70 factor (ECF subfamily)
MTDEELARALYVRGRDAWPAIALDEERFVAYVLARARAAELAAVNAPDLFLACACLHGLPAALDAFERRVLARVGAFVARVDATREFVDEVTQVLRVKLLTGEARIAQFSGRGALDSWVCAAALRTALNLKRDGARPGTPVDALELASLDGDPELVLLRDRYQSEFQTALADALAGRSSKERNLLRYYYLERLTLEKLASLYRVHPTTVMRWIGDAREGVVDGVRRLLAERLQVTPSAFDGLVPLLLSGIDLSLSRLFARP